MKQPIREYNTSERVLYSATETAWQMCETHLAVFSAFKTTYTAAYIERCLQQLREAKRLESGQSLISKRSEIRKVLLEKAKALRLRWQELKRFISDSFDANVVKEQLVQAGGRWYEVRKEEWASLTTLAEMAIAYLAEHGKVLEQKGGMPVNFISLFEEAHTEYEAQLRAFMGLDQVKMTDVSRKLAANNDVYRTVINMLKDGQRVFAKNATLRKLFTWEHLTSLNTTVAAHIRGIVRNQQGVALAGVSITSTDGRYAATTDAKGRYRIDRMEAGNYTLRIEKDGYIDFDRALTLKPGQGHNVDLVMAVGLQKVA